MIEGVTEVLNEVHGKDHAVAIGPPIDDGAPSAKVARLSARFIGRDRQVLDRQVPVDLQIGVGVHMRKPAHHNLATETAPINRPVHRNDDVVRPVLDEVRRCDWCRRRRGHDRHRGIPKAPAT